MASFMLWPLQVEGFGGVTAVVAGRVYVHGVPVRNICRSAAGRAALVCYGCCSDRRERCFIADLALDNPYPREHKKKRPVPSISFELDAHIYNVMFTPLSLLLFIASMFLRFGDVI